jgi:adenylate cyclase
MSRGAVRWQTPGLTVTLTSLTVALVLLSVGAIVAVVSISDRQARDDIELRYGRTRAFAVTGSLRQNLGQATPLLSEARLRVERGLLSVDDPSSLADYLIDKVRYQPDIAFFYYGDQATGRFTGAWRRSDGAIMLARSSPDVDGGQRSEWEVGVDGRLTPFQRDVPAGYDPRQRPWYQLATADQGLIWTEPYPFTSGGVGITAALMLPAVSGPQPRGVFGMDFPLDKASASLADQLQTYWRIREPVMAVVTRSGQPLGYSFPIDDTADAALVAKALAVSPTPIAALSPKELVRFPFEASGQEFVAYVQADNVSEKLQAVTAFIVLSDELYDVVNRTQRIAIGLCLLLVGVAIAACVLLSRRVSRPIRQIAADLEAIGRFELDSPASPRSFVREIVVVADAVDRMKASLRSFGRYVPRQLVQDVLTSGEEARLGGESRPLTLYFSDIAGFTRISETMPPDALVAYLGEYLQEMTSIIEEQDGAVDKFIGDGILALFNAPRLDEDHPAAACRAALRSQARLRELRARWAQQGRQPLYARIGLHTGEAIVGNIGTPERFEYTVAGDAVNLASRLEGLSKVYGTEILASEAVCATAGPAFEWRTVDRVAVVGRQSGTLVCELLGERGQVDPSILQARDLYQLGLTAYFGRDFDQAAGLFGLARAARPNDLAATILEARATALRDNPPADDWDGTYQATSK